MDELIITVAPTGNLPTRDQSAFLPLTPEEIADTAVRCREAGASTLHLHARDATGRPTLDAAVYARSLELIAARTDLIVQISTGMRAGKDPAARAEAVRRLRPEMASLTTGSMNVPNQVYANPPDVVEYLAQAMQQAGTKAEIEVFEAGMIANAQRLAEEGLIATPLHFNFVLGNRGSLPASPKNLLYLSELIPPDGTWTVSAIGRWQLPMAALAIVMGGHVRVGLEDNLYYRRGELATNEQLVARIARLAAELERPVATPGEARRILGLPQRNG